MGARGPAARHRFRHQSRIRARRASRRASDRAPITTCRPLRTVGITGSSLPASRALWLHEHVGEHVQVASISGGTDVVSAFVGGVPTVPVWPGELSAPYLGVALDAFDEQGLPVRGEVGELVVTAPMPSMPVSFWNDADGKRYHDGLFRHLPRRMAPRRLDHHHRARQHRRARPLRLHPQPPRHPDGQRRHLPGRRDSSPRSPRPWSSAPSNPTAATGCRCSCCSPTARNSTDDARRHASRTAIRTEASPRHVPDEIIAAPGIPHTRTGKKLEVPIKQLFQGADPARVVERSAVDDPALLDWYARITPPDKP